LGPKNAKRFFGVNGRKIDKTLPKNMATMQSRQVANKIRIGDLLNGNIIFDGERFSALEVKDRKVSRVNVICNVVDKYSNPDKNFYSLTVDDGTGQIRVKAFTDSAILISGFGIGDTIKLIGWLRYFNNEIYITPEIALRADVKWAYVRKLELLKEYGEFRETGSNEAEKSTAPEEDIVEREKLDLEMEENSKSIIMKKIKSSEDGIDVEKLIMDLKIPVNEISGVISELIAEGGIYEPKPGHLRSLD
jgi:hypothetical protein